jgi:hypothetical protein
MLRIGLRWKTLVTGPLVVIGIFFVGCASSPEVKLASTKMTAALAELDEGIRLFRNRYIAEIERTRTDIGDAMVARMVRNRIERLSVKLEDPEWRERFRNRGLIDLSREIEDTQDTARALVDVVSAIRLRRGETAALRLNELLSRQAKALRKSAEILRQSNQERAAEELETRAAALEKNTRALTEDKRIAVYLEAIIELGAMKAEVPQNLKNLETLVKMLRETHAIIDEWVMTDVIVSGAQVGQLLVEHARDFGLDSSVENGGAE